MYYGKVHAKYPITCMITHTLNMYIVWLVGVHCQNIRKCENVPNWITKRQPFVIEDPYDTYRLLYILIHSANVCMHCDIGHSNKGGRGP